ncbi:MAG TPA: hypothetical protein VGE04_06770, partial [Chloroflexia bacterium]
KNTRITFAGSPTGSTGTVIGADFAELRDLTVENTGGDTYAIAIYNAASPTLSDLTAKASGGITYNRGVDNYYSSPSMSNITATASGNGSSNYGVNNTGGSPEIRGSIISATGAGGAFNHGIHAANSVVTVDYSKVTGSTYSIYSTAGSLIYVGASQLLGGPVLAGGTSFVCTASYDENYVSPGLNICP